LLPQAKINITFDQNLKICTVLIETPHVDIAKCVFAAQAKK
jgi:hypothetical protein